MLKHFAVPVIGLAVLVGAAAPAAADKSKVYVVKPNSQYPYTTQSTKRANKKQNSQQQFNRSLDFETEAVWRNLRPSLFVD